MDNASVTMFTMTAYAFMSYKYGHFTMFLLLYLIIVALNVQLIAVICQHKELRQPMNVFTCNLSVNEIYGSTALLPAVLTVLLSETHEVTLKGCLAQIFFLHTYACIEFCVLALMGYDRYVAICFPLRYRSIMSISRIRKLVVLVWVYPIVVFMGFFSLTLQLTFCETEIRKLFCVNFELVKNSCSTVSHINIVGFLLLMFLVGPQLMMILSSYVQILRVCSKLSKESQVKALKTCVPHLLSLGNFTIGCLIELIQSRFDISHIAQNTRNFMSLYFVIIPPIANPMIYGMGTQAIRVHILRLVLRNTRAFTRRKRTEAAAPLQTGCSA